MLLGYAAPVACGVLLIRIVAARTKPIPRGRIAALVACLAATALSAIPLAAFGWWRLPFLLLGLWDP